MSELAVFPVSETIERMLRAAYQTPSRAYHHFGHVLDVLDQFARVPVWEDREAVGFAILFHDAIYVAGRADNEAKSAELAASLLEGSVAASRIARVQHLVRLTARHGSFEPREVDHDTAQFLDCDMAILGSPAPTYDAYERAIAKEYAHVPGSAYRIGRAMFLRKLLASPSIYHSDFFHAELEVAARANLERALSVFA